MDVTSVLVVGCGYIGLPFAWQAKSAGLKVFVTTRKKERFDSFQKLGLVPIKWDVAPRSPVFFPEGEGTGRGKSKAVLEAYLESRNDPLPRVDAVVYAVGYDRSSGRSIDEVYVQGLGSTLSALQGKPKIVYASSTGVYGDSAGAVIDEQASVQPTDASGEACRNAEVLLQTFCALNGLDFCILRFAGIYGVGRLLNAEPLKRGDPIPADGAAWLNLVEQQDAAMALWKAVLLGESGEIYNIADGHPARRQEYYLKLAELLNTPPPKFAPELARRQRGNRRINADKARWKLGWSPKYPSYVEGLEAIIRAENSSGEPGA